MERLVHDRDGQDTASEGDDDYGLTEYRPTKPKRRRGQQLGISRTANVQGEEGDTDDEHYATCKQSYSG